MIEPEKYDVAIIGGGLAGLCLAIQCADRRYNVILFEKEEYPFHKVCGEYISLESWDFLQKLGVKLSELNLPIIKTLNISGPNGKAYAFNLPLGGFGISRFLLDNTLYHIALMKGVEIRTKTKVSDVEFNDENFTISSAGKTVRAKVAAGTFGKRSNIDIKWNRAFTRQKATALNNYVGIKYHIKFDHPANMVSLHNFYNGYCGISKIENDKSCLCYLTTAANLKNCGNSIGEMQEKVLYKNPALKEIFNSAIFLYEQPLAISQISFEKKLQVENHVLMLGDAAGVISPLCGNGMSMAMHSTKIAFEKIQLFLSASISRAEMEQQYMVSWQEQFYKRLLIGRTVQRFFGEKRSTAIFLKTMNFFPAIAQKLIRSTHGETF